MIALKISLASAVAIAAMAPTTIPSEAAPLPTHIGTMKSMLADNVTPVRWVGGWGRGWGGGWGFRGGGFRPWGAFAAGALIGGALASAPLYGGYPYYGSYAYVGYPYPAYDCYGYGGYGWGGNPGPYACPSGFYPGYTIRYYGW